MTAFASVTAFGPRVSDCSRETAASLKAPTRRPAETHAKKHASMCACMLMMGCRALPFGSRGGARWPTAGGGSSRARRTARRAQPLPYSICQKLYAGPPQRHGVWCEPSPSPKLFSADFLPQNRAPTAPFAREWMATGMSASLSTPLRCDDSLASNYAGTLLLTAARPHCKPSLLDGVLSQALRRLASQHRGSAPMR